MLYLGIDPHRKQMTVSLRNHRWRCHPSVPSQYPVAQTPGLSGTIAPGRGWR